MKEKNVSNHKFIKILIGLITILIVITLYGRFVATNKLEVKEYKISDPNISDNFYGLKVVHISDIHYGQTVNKKYLSKLVKEVNLVKPDIVVLTGDLLDSKMDMSEDDINELTSELSKINASIGKYAVSGDNDVHFDNWSNIVSNCDFKVIDNNYELIYSSGYTPLLLAGIGSTDIDNIKEQYTKIEEFINSSDQFNSIYKILLIHQPDLIDYINYSRFNLVLAGHSLGGQINLSIINKWFLPSNAKKYPNGYYKLDNTDLYVSNGIGTSSFKFRLFNTPSINLYRLSNK